MKRSIRLSALLTYLIIGIALPALPGSTYAKSIGKDQVNIRSGPSIKSRVILRAPLGTPIKIEKEKGDWVFFRDWLNNTGWVHKPLISDIETAVILVENANMRSSASIKSEVVAKATRGEIYKVLEKNGKWVHLGYYMENEPVGWVRSDLVFGE
ncbi:MAG: SH3 domain-containing protein [Syntrophobacteraceae bacterium]